MDKADGFGKFTYSDGSYYEGQWKKDLQNGFGVEKWADGSQFEGFYKDGKK